MKKNFWTKGVAAAGILTALYAGSVFAATPEEDASMQKQGQSYNQKLESGQEQEVIPEQRAVQTEDAFTRQSRTLKSKDSRENDRIFQRRDGMHPKTHGRSDGPRASREGAFHRNRQNGFRHPYATEKLTPEQRKQLAAEREQFFADWSSMTEEQRHAATERFIARINEEKMKNMSEAEKRAFMKRQDERRAEREKVAKMSEDERHAYFQKKHDQMVKERAKNMDKEEKARFLEREKHRQERMDEFWKKWKTMTPAEKEQWRKEHPRRAFAPDLKGDGLRRSAPAPEK